MTNQVITTEVTALDIIRAEAVSDIIRGYGATKAYAEHLFSFFGSDWYMYEHNDKAEAAKGILSEGQAFRDALRKAGHSNPSVVWTRVRNEGRKLAEGEGESESAEGEGTEAAGTKQVRGLTLRLVQELTLLFQACKREEAKNNLDAKQAQAAIHVSSALQALGVDLSMIKTGK